jgi:signal transduction histidine kinase
VRLTILVKLILAYVIPTVLLFAVFATIAHEIARDNLEEELGARLTAVAAAAATELRDPTLARLEPGSEDDVRHQRCRARLEAVRQATGVARIYAFSPALQSVCDTAADVPIGTPYFQLQQDAVELERVFGQRAAVASVLFEGHDGQQYKAGYAPVDTDDGEVVMAVGVDAPATYFDRLGALRRTLVLYGAGFAAVVLLVSVVMAALVTHPARRLVDAAERIGRGDLTQPIARTSSDELGTLADTMDQMRAGLAARDERMQLMLSGIAHEVRNPLGGIALFAGILRDELGDNEELKGHVQRIEKELAHLKAVVGDFLDYARRPKPELARVDVGELGADLMDFVRTDAEAAGVTVACEAGGVTCVADAGQLKRALLNLLRNAIQAAEGKAGLRARTRDGAVVIEVWNATSTPIPEDVRGRIFEPFFTTKEKGTGLGLAFVREIALDHGGTIEVQSDVAGGTVFALSLPQA